VILLVGVSICSVRSDRRVFCRRREPGNATGVVLVVGLPSSRAYGVVALVVALWVIGRRDA